MRYGEWQDAFETRVSREFQNEVDMLSQVEHLNLVRLIGYLEEEHERILVTEYVPNGNLRQHLDGTFSTLMYGYEIACLAVSGGTVTPSLIDVHVQPF